MKNFLAEVAEKYGLLPKKKDAAIGNMASEHLLSSHAIQAGCCAVVTAHRDKGGETWSFIGTLDGERVIDGTIYGGRWKASQYIRYVRNGIVSRRMKGKVNPKGGEE